MMRPFFGPRNILDAIFKLLKGQSQGTSQIHLRDLGSQAGLLGDSGLDRREKVVSIGVEEDNTPKNPQNMIKCGKI